MAGTKRIARVPQEALCLAEDISKADLLEVSWYLASLCNDAGSADDDDATMRRLLDEINVHRASRSARELPPIGQLRAKWAEWRTSAKAMAERWTCTER